MTSLLYIHTSIVGVNNECFSSCAVEFDAFFFFYLKSEGARCPWGIPVSLGHPGVVSLL